MKSCVAEFIKDVVALMEVPEGDTKQNIVPVSKFKPPRLDATKTKSRKTDYFKNYMTERRDQGKDYQKMPDKVKQFRRDQKKKFKNKLEEKE